MSEDWTMRLKETEWRVERYLTLLEAKGLPPNVAEHGKQNNSVENRCLLAGGRLSTVRAIADPHAPEQSMAALSAFEDGFELQSLSSADKPEERSIERHGEDRPDEPEDEIRSVIRSLGLNPDLARCNNSDEARAVRERRRR